VLFGDNVFDVVGEFVVLLAQLTVFASAAGSLPDQLPRGGVYLLLTIRKRVVAGLDFKNGDEIRRIDQRFVLGPFLFGEGAVVGAFCQGIDSLLNRRSHAQCQDSLRGFRVQAAAKWIQ
jgi:hypothetical protein